MDTKLEGKKIALLATDGFEDSEFTSPYEAIKQSGATVTVVSIDSGEIKGKDGTTYTVEALVDDCSSEEFDGLLLPGGVGNPDKLRVDESAVTFVREFFDAGKPIAAICHAPWMLVEADVVRNKTLTSWPSLRTDITNAGGTWVDEEAVVDGKLLTSRNPGDLDVFCEKAVRLFSGE